MNVYTFYCHGFYGKINFILVFLYGSWADQPERQHEYILRITTDSLKNINIDTEQSDVVNNSWL